jgi:hypothetical protein
MLSPFILFTGRWTGRYSTGEDELGEGSYFDLELPYFPAPDTLAEQWINQSHLTSDLMQEHYHRWAFYHMEAPPFNGNICSSGSRVLRCRLPRALSFLTLSSLDTPDMSLVHPPQGVSVSRLYPISRDTVLDKMLLIRPGDTVRVWLKFSLQSGLSPFICVHMEWIKETPLSRVLMGATIRAEMDMQWDAMYFNIFHGVVNSSWVHTLMKPSKLYEMLWDGALFDDILELRSLFFDDVQARLLRAAYKTS